MLLQPQSGRLTCLCHGQQRPTQQQQQQLQQKLDRQSLSKLPPARTKPFLTGTTTSGSGTTPLA
jgi:hypothetical protein